MQNYYKFFYLAKLFSFLFTGSLDGNDENDENDENILFPLNSYTKKGIVIIARVIGAVLA